MGLLGHSLGAAAAMEIANRLPSTGSPLTLEAIILSAPFTSIAAMGKLLLSLPVPEQLIRGFLEHPWDNVAAARQLCKASGPLDVTVVHGAQDELIPTKMGRSVAETLRTCGHNVRWVEKF